MVYGGKFWPENLPHVHLTDTWSGHLKSPEKELEKKQKKKQINKSHFSGSRYS